MVGVDQAGEGDARGVAARVGEEDRAATVSEVEIGFLFGTAGRVGDEVERATREVKLLLIGSGGADGGAIVAAIETGGAQAETRVRVGGRIIEFEGAAGVDGVIGEGSRDAVSIGEHGRTSGHGEEARGAAGGGGRDGERADVVVEEVAEDVA